MMRVRLVALVLGAFVLEAGGQRGVDVGAVARDGRVYVSAKLTGDVLSGLEDAIQAGLTATITYEAELRHPVSVWFDSTIASARVAASVQHDTLTRRYQISRTVDGRVDDSRISGDRADVARFVTGFDRLPLFSTADLDPNEEYYVRVRVRTRPSTTWFFWPWGRDAASGVARFTFIP
ncbi:MAG TPA: DUF4390 domain-containing protein [Vicinamibacterales bacterium]|nr:DUF4390 domain-containing protein [Vicinamibacterales bacterium]HPK72666.1 DUF4390 domain-containing protein [Vicinamibacterales bacterium]